jgi:hypothetical protein
MGYESRLKALRDTNKVPEYQIMISLLPSGKVQVSGPLIKTEMCLEMLKTAGQVIIAYRQETVAAQGPVLVAPDGSAIVKNGGS